MKIYHVLIILYLNTFLFAVESNWFHVYPLPHGTPLIDVAYCDKNTIIAVGLLGTIIKSYNNGQSWKIIDNPFREHLNSLYMTSSQVGFAAGYMSVIKTNDAGET